MDKPQIDLKSENDKGVVKSTRKIPWKFISIVVILVIAGVLIAAYTQIFDWIKESDKNIPSEQPEKTSIYSPLDEKERTGDSTPKN